jgi:hypothetical protein
MAKGFEVMKGLVAGDPKGPVGKPAIGRIPWKRGEERQEGFLENVVHVVASRSVGSKDLDQDPTNVSDQSFTVEEGKFSKAAEQEGCRRFFRGGFHGHPLIFRKGSVSGVKSGRERKKLRISRQGLRGFAIEAEVLLAISLEDVNDAGHSVGAPVGRILSGPLQRHLLRVRGSTQLFAADPLFPLNLLQLLLDLAGRVDGSMANDVELDGQLVGDLGGPQAGSSLLECTNSLPVGQEKSA